MQADLFAGHQTEAVNVSGGRECDVYCGRPTERFPEGSHWANPYRIKSEAERQRAITNYRAGLMANPVLLLRIPELQGKRLGCWCAPKACHCSVLAELAEGPRLRLLEAHMAARLSFGKLSEPARTRADWLPWLQSLGILPAGLKRWAEVQEAHASAAVAALAAAHAGVDKARWRC